MRIIKIPDDGIIRIPITRGKDTVGIQNIDLSMVSTIDAVPVVRCRECQHYDHGCCVVKRYEGDDNIIAMPPDGYCSYGQPKEAAHD